MRLQPVVGAPPAGFDRLRAEARAGGYRMLDTLADEWTSGENRFARPGEALYAAYRDGELAGIGGLTVEPAIPGAFRMRRFYVLAAYRRAGIARQLATALLASIGPGRTVTTNAAAGSEPLWESLGFVPDRRNSWSHILRG